MADNVVLTTPNTEAINKPVVTPGDKGEPPSEWASSTLEALGPVTYKSELAEDSQSTNKEPMTTSFSADASSTATTPGVPIPGAYPRDSHARSSSISEDVQYVKEFATNAFETAKEYMFGASEQVGAKVGEYVPESMASYLPPSLQQPHSDATNATSGPAETAQKPDEVTLEGIPTSSSTSPETLSQAHDEPNSETMRESNLASLLSTPSPDNGASENASIRSLAGSQALDRQSPNTVTESDSYSLAVAPTVAEFPQLNAELMKKPEDAPNAENATDNQERPELERHADETRHIPPVDPTAPSLSTETKWHAPDPNAPGQVVPNVTARNYPVGSVDSKGFVHRDSVRSDLATPGHGDAATASPAMPPGVGIPSKEKDKDEADHSQDDALTRVGNHAVTVSSGITAADLAQTGAAPAMAGAGATTAVPDATPPPPPAKEKEMGGSNVTPTSTSTSSTSHKPTVPSEPAAGKPPSSSPSHSQASAGKTKSGFMDKIKGEIKVLSGKLEHKQEKVDEGKKMMGKSANKN